MDWSYVRDAAIALVPTTGVCILFYLAMKAIINADRNERQAERELLENTPADKPAQNQDTTSGSAD